MKDYKANNKRTDGLAAISPEVIARSVIKIEVVGERIVSEGSFMLRAEWLKLSPSGAAQPNDGATPAHEH